MAEISKRLGRKCLADAACIANPDTILAWYRRLVAQKFDGSKRRAYPGRPKPSTEWERLIVRIAKENSGWGYDRIAGALANLGHRVADQTIGNILKRHGIPPVPKRSNSTSWKDFIAAHKKTIIDTNKENLARVIAFGNLMDGKATFILTLALALTGYLVSQLGPYLDAHAKWATAPNWAPTFFVILDGVALACLTCFTLTAINVIRCMKPRTTRHTGKTSPLFFTYLILAGSFDIVVNGRTINKRIPNDHIGEMAAIQPTQRRSATVVARESSVVMKLAEPQLATLGDQYPHIWRCIAKELARRLEQRNSLITAVSPNTRVFIVSSAEAIDIARTIQNAFDHDPFSVVVWTDGVFRASHYAIDSLERILDQTDVAIAIGEPDDLTESRGDRHSTPRDNVIFELGFFMDDSAGTAHCWSSRAGKKSNSRPILQASRRSRTATGMGRTSRARSPLPATACARLFETSDPTDNERTAAMGLRSDLITDIATILRTQWDERDGRTVPDDDGLTLGNNAVKLQATVLYADLADSTHLVDGRTAPFAAEMYKTFLHCAAKIIRAEEGTITAYDGDRIMAVYIGDQKNSSAVRTALKIHDAVATIINPAQQAMYQRAPYTLKHVVGIDTSTLYVAKTGVRGANDLVWVGRAANYAAKLASLPDTHASYITQEVYNAAQPNVKTATDGRPMWGAVRWNTFDDRIIYRSHWRWTIA